MERSETDGKYAYERLDRLMHEKARLSIMTSLYARREGCSFNELKDLCSLTDGNLSRHLSILKDADLINIKKNFVRNKPVTSCEMTDKGMMKFRDYLSELEQIIKDAAEVEDVSEFGAESQGFSTA